MRKALRTEHACRGFGLHRCGALRRKKPQKQNTHTHTTARNSVAWKTRDKGHLGVCRGRVGGVSGACRERVGGVSGEFPPTRPRHAPDTPPTRPPLRPPRHAPRWTCLPFFWQDKKNSQIEFPIRLRIFGFRVWDFTLKRCCSVR